MAVPLVLIAEDDPSLAEVVRRYLVSEGYAVVTVHDGAEAVEQTWVRRTDLVVLDVMMPGLDGLEVCRRLRARSDRLAETPILMLTSRRRVLLDGVEVRCTPVERALLTAIAAQPGRAFTRLQLLRHADGLDRARPSEPSTCTW